MVYGFFRRGLRFMWNLFEVGCGGLQLVGVGSGLFRHGLRSMWGGFNLRSIWGWFRVYIFRVSLSFFVKGFT